MTSRLTKRGFLIPKVRFRLGENGEVRNAQFEGATAPKPHRSGASRRRPPARGPTDGAISALGDPAVPWAAPRAIGNGDRKGLCSLYGSLGHAGRGRAPADKRMRRRRVVG